MANRKHDATGRSKKDARHIRLYHWEMGTPAFASLSPVAKALYLEFKRRYNGSNNGQIHLSHRDAAKAANVSVNTVKAGLHELAAKGFIRIAQMGSFSQKARNATTWILTEYEYNGLPTKDFARLTEHDARSLTPLKNKTRYQSLIRTVSAIHTGEAESVAPDTS